MITRAHKLLFVVMLLACVVMAAVLIRLRERAQDRLQAQAESAPALPEAENNAARDITLYLPNDLDDSLTAVQQSVPMPADANAQARVVLSSLMHAFGQPGSTHRIEVVSGVNEVYVMPVPQAQGQTAPASQLAIVDLSGALAVAQPSGIEPETLTLLSMIATLHANLPSITQVHFLIDGQPRPTLAGHADLTRTYEASEAIPQAGPGGATQ
jgi:hypothetical protein